MSRRAGTGRGPGRQRRGWGREGEGRLSGDRRRARLDQRSRRRGEPGALRGWGWGSGAWWWGGGREAGAGGRSPGSLPSPPRAVRPERGRGWEAPVFPAQAWRWCQVWEEGQRLGATWRHAPLPYFLPLFLGSRPRVRSPGTRWARRVWRGESGSQGGRLRAHTSRQGPRAGGDPRGYWQVIGTWGRQDSDMNRA